MKRPAAAPQLALAFFEGAPAAPAPPALTPAAPPPVSDGTGAGAPVVVVRVPVSCRGCGAVAHLLPQEMARCSCGEIVHAHPDYMAPEQPQTTAQKPPPPRGLEELTAISTEIFEDMHGALGELAAVEEELARGPVPLDAPPHHDPEWIVFVASDPLRIVTPAKVAASNRWAAERAVGRAFRVPASRCYAVPIAQVAMHDQAIALEDHPDRKPEPVDLCEAVKIALDGEIERGDESLRAQREILAQVLKCDVDEVDQKLAEQKAETQRGRPEPDRKPPRGAPKNAVKQSPGAPAIEAGMRQLTERQRELLALVDVDPKTNRVVYTRDEHVPDWAALKQAVEALGGVWRSAGKKVRGGWVFPDGIDAMDAIEHARDTGLVFDEKLVGLYPTPDELADALVAQLVIRPEDVVLEPSAGRGALALAVRRACPEARIVCVELIPENVDNLRNLGFEVHEGDFLKKTAAKLGGPFSVVCMNPPFGDGRPELHHMVHALGMLKDAGRLGAIMPQSLKFRTDPRTVEVREQIARHGAIITANERGAFRESGTMVHTLSVTLTKRAA